MKKIPCLIERNGSAIVDWERVEIHVPDSYFDEPSIAENYDGILNTVAFVDIVGYMDEKTVKPRKFALRLPARLHFSYSDTSKFTDETGERFRVFTAYRGEVLLEKMKIVRSAANVLELFKIISGARITEVEYDELAALLIDGSELNGVNLGLPNAVLEAMVADMARWNKDDTIPLRVALNTGKATTNDFKFIRLKSLPRLNSVMTGISFEDINMAVQTGIVTTIKNRRQNISPVEHYMKF